MFGLLWPCLASWPLLVPGLLVDLAGLRPDLASSPTRPYLTLLAIFDTLDLIWPLLEAILASCFTRLGRQGP